MQTNQTGRSMVEMLGVLGIIGVLSVGGLAIIGKARRQQEITQSLSEISQLIESVKKMSCQYDKEYGDYANFLKQSDAYPSELEFTYVANNSKFTLSSDVDVKMTAILNNDTNVDPYMVLEISNMDDDMCVNLATSDWGRTNSNGYIGASFSTNNDFTGMKANYPRMDPGAAATGCVDAAKLYLGFKTCNCPNCH